MFNIYYKLLTKEMEEGKNKRRLVQTKKVQKMIQLHVVYVENLVCVDRYFFFFFKPEQ